MTELPHSRSCFVCGSRNAIGLNLRFQTDGQVVQSRFTPRPEHNGFINVVHGGLLATLLDEMMVWACAVQTRRFSYCAEMTVRYLAPAQPDQVMLAQANLVANKRDRLFLAEGSLQREDGIQIATATGKYMPIRDVDVSQLIADFEGTPEQLSFLLNLPGRPS
jgi:uncharacterized protein (TIGR00369 family)